MKQKPIKIIDLFAGPGGLGEGFSSLEKDGKNPFHISVSVEMEFSAWKTLRLRAFVRQFINRGKEIPNEYYEYLSGKLGDSPEDQLFKIYHNEAKAAEDEALQLTLGNEEDNKTIYKKIKEKLGEDKNWVLIGGPPCQAYSLVGRARNKGKKDYVAEKDHRHYLYLEYLKIIEEFSPSVFVMENVKGILSSKLDGELVFDRILEDLKDPSKALDKESKQTYKIYSLVAKNKNLEGLEPVFAPKEFIIKSEEYGIPQARHRVILVGVRNDINQVPDILKTVQSVSTDEVIKDLPKLRSGLSKKKERNTSEGWAKVIEYEITKYKNKKLSRSLEEAFSADYKFTSEHFFGKFPNIIITSSSKLAENNPPDLAYLIERNNIKNNALSLQKNIEKTLERIKNNKLNQGNKFLQKANNLYNYMPKELSNWYGNNWKGGICNHESRSHMDSDLARYLFCSTFAETLKQTNEQIRNSPKLKNFPEVLLPNHKNAKSGKFVDRFKVQEKGIPATTITSHISKDGHYFIHYDPIQCRSLTVREAARIQTFPDNYFFEGNRTEQYHQVGNAVPPLLAHKISKIIIKLLDTGG